MCVCVRAVPPRLPHRVPPYIRSVQVGSAAPAGSRAGVGGGRIRGWGRPLGQLLRAAAWKTPHVEEERSGDREPRARGYRAGTRCARHGGPAARRRVPPAPRLPSLPLTSQPFVSSQPFGASVPRPAAPASQPSPQLSAQPPRLPQSPQDRAGRAGPRAPRGAGRCGSVGRGGQKMSAPRRRPRAPSGVAAPRGRSGRVAALRGRERVPRGGVCALKILAMYSFIYFK